MQILQNTTKNLLTLRDIPENTVVKIYNIDGKIVKRISSVCKECKIDISFLKKGLYMIKTYSKEYFLSELLIKE